MSFSSARWWTLGWLALMGPGCIGALRADFELSGRITRPIGAESTVVVEREWLEERRFEPVATGAVRDGRLQLNVDAEPGLFVLRVGDARVSFVAGERQRLEVEETSRGNLRVTGGPDQLLYAEYEAFRTASLAERVLRVREAIARARSAGLAEEVTRLTEAEISGYQQHRRELVDFTLQRLGGSPTLYAASLRWEGDHRLTDLATMVRAYAGQHPDLQISGRLLERIRRFEATAIGSVAPDLVGPGPDQLSVSLRDLRGSVVLVDFWASWCAPCRSENRHYAELYRTYRDAGFEILAVSVDHDGRAWKAAIAKDGATWRQIGDLTGWKSPLAARYNVTALPASFLVDREGRIVAKDTRGPALVALLEKLLRPTGVAVDGG